MTAAIEWAKTKNTLAHRHDGEKEVFMNAVAMKKGILSVVFALLFAFGMTLAVVALKETVAVKAADDYPEKYKKVAKDALVDDWNFYNRECTSFVAWCINNRNGLYFHNWYGGVRWGNANNWGNAARNLGITVDNNPAIGAIAWWSTGKYGHVAWVSEVKGDRIVIEEYNLVVLQA